MGETHGTYIDHKSAQRIIEILSKTLNMKIDVTKLAEKAKESEVIIKKLEEELHKGQKLPIPPQKKPGEISYIR